MTGPEPLEAPQRGAVPALDDAFWAEVDATNWRIAGSSPLAGLAPTKRVPSALLQLAAANSKSSAQAAYTVTLDAIGHNHSGRLFPSVRPAAPFLLRLALDGQPWAQFAALEMLIDVLCWAPARGEEDWAGVDRDTLQQLIQPAKASLLALGATPLATEDIRRAAQELVDELR